MMVLMAAITVGSLLAAPGTPGLTAEVRENEGSVLLYVNGEPRTPMMLFGWAPGPSSTPIEIGTAWQEYHLTFTAPEDNKGHCGIHVRVGATAGPVWVDDARFYEGPYREDGADEQFRCGDWECEQGEADAAWTLFVKTDAGAEASWAFDEAEVHEGSQSCRIDVAKPGQEHWHVHLYQSGLSVEKGKEYTFSVWLKSGRERSADMHVLHHGEPWTIYSGGEDAPMTREVELAAKAGVHMHSFGLTMPWPRPGEERDFAKVDQALERILEADPEGLLLPRFGVEPPAWWYDEHPDDALHYDDGTVSRVCVASEAWRAEVVEHVRALVAHCEEAYGEHMLGYHPCAQHTGEWFYPRTWEARHSGFGPAMQRGFAKWLKAKYGSDEGLRAAWGQADVSLENVPIPSVEERCHAALGVFRDPQHERSVIDFHAYQQIAMVEPLELIAPVIKEAAEGRKLVVFFYGYYFEISGLPLGPQSSGHLAMARLLACPDVDIVCSPISYQDRGLGGMSAFMVPVDSVRAHGKLWLNEDDTRTYLTPEDAGFGRVDTPQHTHWVHQRGFGQMFPRRLACWYMDLGGTGWLAGEDIWQEIGKLRVVYDQHLAEPASWAPEVAVIVDEEGPFYLVSNNTVMAPLGSRFRKQLYRMGAPFSMYLLSDLVAGRVPASKVYVFVGCFHLEDEAREAIAEQIQDHTAVWMYGSGYLADEADTAQMSALVGMPLEMMGGDPTGMVTVAESETALTKGLGGTQFGVDTKLDPCWAVAPGKGVFGCASSEGEPTLSWAIEPGKEVEVIGTFAGGAVGTAAVDTGEGRSIYIGTLDAPARLLRNILQSAGVHVYLDSDDVLLTDGQFLSVTASSEGEKTILLPQACRVVSLPGGEVVSDSAERIEAEFAMGETRMYWLE